jgi:hypothetical protein
VREPFLQRSQCHGFERVVFGIGEAGEPLPQLGGGADGAGQKADVDDMGGRVLDRQYRPRGAQFVRFDAELLLRLSGKLCVEPDRPGRLVAAVLDAARGRGLPAAGQVDGARMATCDQHMVVGGHHHAVDRQRAQRRIEQRRLAQLRVGAAVARPASLRAVRVDPVQHEDAAIEHRRAFGTGLLPEPVHTCRALRVQRRCLPRGGDAETRRKPDPRPFRRGA